VLRSFHNKFCTFATCHDTDMIEMCIHKDKLLPIFIIFKYSPCTNSGQCSIPTSVRALGIGRGKPKRTVLYQFKSVLAVKYRRVLPFMSTIIASDAYRLKPEQLLSHILHLFINTFLDAKNIKFVKLD